MQTMQIPTDPIDRKDAQKRPPFGNLPQQNQMDSSGFANPFDDPLVAETYEEWYETKGKRADRLEKRLIARLLRDFPNAKVILEVGSGSGHFTRWLDGLNFDVYGLDLSQVMLRQAIGLGSGSYLQGEAHTLPFVDGSFDLVLLLTTLEFLPQPELVLAEAVRVARQGILLGVLNRHSWLGWSLRFHPDDIRKNARLYTPQELMDLLKHAAKDRPMKIYWRTTLWPLLPVSLPWPWGDFIGMSGKLMGSGKGNLKQGQEVRGENWKP